MARGQRGAEAEPDLEPIAPPGWPDVPRHEPQALSRQTRAVIALFLAIAGTLGADAYGVHHITSVRAAESLVEHLATAQALERMRGRADQELRLQAMFPDDLAAYNEAVQALGHEHAKRVADLAGRVEDVGSIDSTVRRARAQLAEALNGQVRSILEEIKHNGTIYDTLGEEWPQAVEAVQAAGRRWGVATARAAPAEFKSIAAVLAQWRRPIDVATGGLRLVLAGDDLRTIDLDSGETRTLASRRFQGGYQIGQWVLAAEEDNNWFVFDLKSGESTPVAADWFILGGDGTTVWAVRDEETAVELRLPATPTGARFDGRLAADTGRHLAVVDGVVEFGGGPPGFVLLDRATRKVVQRVDDGFIMGTGRDALAYVDGEERLHLLMAGDDRVVDVGDSGIGNVVFTPDGKTAAIGTFSQDGAGRVFIVGEGAPPRELAGLARSPFHVLEWAANGNWLLVSDSRRTSLIDMSDGSIHRIRLRTGNDQIVGVL